MQTRRKPLTRNSAREHASPRVCRLQKKASENMQVVEKNVTELITSSARKQRLVQPSAGPKKSRDPVAATKLNTNHSLAHGETRDRSLVYDTVEEARIGQKDCNKGNAECVLETIFSPAFHISKDLEGGIANGGTICSVDEMEVDSSVLSDHKDEPNCGSDMPSDAMVVDSHCDLDGTNLSSEVSAIYLAMQHSKLECVDDHTQVSMSTEVCVDEDDIEEIDDFDPYLFIKNLPELSSVVPTFRPMLLPKQTRRCPPITLVLDLDETLVHSTLEHCDDADFTFPVNFNLKEHTVYVRCRPYLKDFMERVANLFEIIIFTASQSIYAERLLNVLDPKRRIFRHRVYRESCVFVEGNYLKDLSVLGRDLARVVIIDNSPQAFGFQVDNGIPIESWFDDRSDQELLLLLPFLESLVGVEDVRPSIAKKFNLREKIAAAVYPSLNYKGDLFER
ncbi:PREDICTED: CTD small phosphatase-like protein 2 isoform X2 [Nelumbo nucifera]|uniref:CTD small phosphatase-like protein 2 isoform X2 n=1 Tax=Nelumbo nucifera TaxID=4432 RepID=A0A1U7ZB26_NELNU|nr:PREDICTED: CTD small phosphatase-like protein 2 isoform X2 [Nelumbo nucifera]